MKERSQAFRFFHQLTLAVSFLLLIVVSVVAEEEITGTRKDGNARIAADAVTHRYQRAFTVGVSIEQVKAVLDAEHTAMLSRGTDLLVVVQEGRPLWYCSHNYFGTAFRVEAGVVRQIATQQWPETCL